MGRALRGEHGEALLDPRLKVEKLALLLAQALVLGVEPRRLTSSRDGLLDQGQVPHSHVAIPEV